MRADYKCDTCETVFEYIKPYGDEYPKSIPCENLVRKFILKKPCEGIGNRYFSSSNMPRVEIASGENGITYHSAPATPKKMSRKSSERRSVYGALTNKITRKDYFLSKSGRK